jgi:hypothetical protein
MNAAAIRMFREMKIIRGNPTETRASNYPGLAEREPPTYRTTAYPTVWTWRNIPAAVFMPEWEREDFKRI